MASFISFANPAWQTRIRVNLQHKKGQMNKGCKFLKKLGRYVGGGNNNIIWFYQQS